MKGIWIRDYPIAVGSNNIAPTTRYVQTWRANSIYDPDASSSSVSDSSMFWSSNMNQQYFQYCVHSAKIKICGYVRNLAATNYNPCRVYLIASDQSTPPTDETGILLHPNHRTKIIDPLLSSTKGGNNWFTFKMHKRTKDIFSRKLLEDVTQDSGLTGGSGTGSNPLNIWYYHLVIYNGYTNTYAGSGNDQFTWYRTKLIFNTKFLDRKDVQSGDYYGTNVPV